MRYARLERVHLLALTTDFSGVVRLYHLDDESARTNAELGRKIQSHDEAIGDWTYEAVETLEAALSGADFVVCSTQDPPTSPSNTSASTTGGPTPSGRGAPRQRNRTVHIITVVSL